MNSSRFAFLDPRATTFFVRHHDTGVKRIHHPVVGDVELTYEALILRAESELTMFAYTAEPGSKSTESLDLIASWAATPESVE